MKSQRRKILLLTDNAPSHKIPEDEGSHSQMHGFNCISMENVLILFLPPNTTSHVQPLDAGIIRSFKAGYRRKQMSWLIEKADAATRDSHIFKAEDAKPSLNQVQ